MALLSVDMFDLHHGSARVGGAGGAVEATQDWNKSSRASEADRGD